MPKITPLNIFGISLMVCALVLQMTQAVPFEFQWFIVLCILGAAIGRIPPGYRPQGQKAVGWALILAPCFLIFFEYSAAPYAIIAYTLGALMVIVGFALTELPED